MSTKQKVTGKNPATGQADAEQNSAIEQSPEEQKPITEQTGVVKIPKRKRIKFNATLNYDELKKLESTTVSSCLELANKVILVDGVPFGEAKYKDFKDREQNFKLNNGRKNDFLRLIENYAVIEYIGIKCHVAKVFDKEERNEIGNIFLKKRIDKLKHS